ncbi:MAG: tetratricopeptide repeat protein [Bryobacteraceae bacterium]
MARKERHKAKPAAPSAPAGPRWWHWALGVFLALFVAFQSYAPALDGPFVFDDNYLPMNQPNPSAELRTWVIAVRPVLFLTYWMNFRYSGTDPRPYHAANVVIHVACALLVFFVARRLAGGFVAPAVAGAVFLLHPVQTESVAYIAGRSESLSAMFFLAAFALFLYRREEAVSWRVSAGVLALFGAALGSKEHTIVLPAALLLTDLFFYPDRIRRNWRLYGPIVLGGIGGAAFVIQRIGGPTTAGFGIKEFTWYEYLFTQFRVVWMYPRLFLFPAGLNADYDFPISRSLLDRGSVVGLAGIVLALAAVVVFRKRYRLACFGALFFLLVLAPTSTVIPIKDPIAERRMYLPMVGLLLIVVDLARAAPRKTLAVAGAGAALLCAVLTHERSRVWSGPEALWRDTIAKSPRNGRAHFQLASTYYAAGRCREALAEYGQVAALRQPDHELLVDWGLALDCAGQSAEAAAKLTEAAALDRTAHVYSQLGMVHGKAGRVDEAMRALETAIQIDPEYDMTYVYRGHVYLSRNEPALAVADYRRALELNGSNALARASLAQAEQRLKAR